MKRAAVGGAGVPPAVEASFSFGGNDRFFFSSRDAVTVLVSSLLTTFLILGCVSKKGMPGEDEGEGGHEVNFAGMGKRKTVYLSMAKDILNAAYSVLGQNVMMVADAQAEMDAAKAMLADYEAMDEANLTGETYVMHWFKPTETAAIPKSEYIQCFKNEVAQAQATLIKAESTLEESKAYLTTLREEAGVEVAPIAKMSTAMYNAKFEEAVAKETAAAQQYTEALEKAKEVLPQQAVNADGKKMVRQPAATPDDDNNWCRNSTTTSKHDPMMIQSFQKAGVTTALSFFAMIYAAVLKQDDSISKADLKGSSVAKKVKRVDRLMEKAYSRHKGNASMVTDYGRLTFTASTLKVLLSIFNVILSVCTTGSGYTILRIKNLLSTEIAHEEVAINSGYRNTNILLLSKDNGHVFEVQLNLWSLEAVKNGPSGHQVFEIIRKLGYSTANSCASGAMTPLVLKGIVTGRIMELTFARQIWTKKTAAMLKEALSSKGCRVITAILVQGQGDTAAMAQAVAGALEVNDSVKTIALYGNDLDDVAVVALAEAIKVNKTLGYMSLEDNRNLGDVAVVALAEAIKVNKTLAQLILNNCNFGEVGGVALAEAMKVNTTIINLDGLYSNDISDESRTALEEAYERNASNQVWVPGYPIGGDG